MLLFYKEKVRSSVSYHICKHSLNATFKPYLLTSKVGRKFFYTLGRVISHLTSANFGLTGHPSSKFLGETKRATI